METSTKPPPTAVNFASYPLKDIPQPHPHDVLCGRGGGTNNHVGNSHWRMLVAANKQLYITLPKRQKMLLSRSIVNAVRSQNPPGRFLQKDSKSNSWFDVGDQRAQEKTSQALREGAPDIRNKIAQQKDKQSKDDVEATENSTATPGDSNVKKEEPTEAKPEKKTKTNTQTATTSSNADASGGSTPPKPGPDPVPAQAKPPVQPVSALPSQPGSLPTQPAHPGQPVSTMMNPFVMAPPQMPPGAPTMQPLPPQITVPPNGSPGQAVQPVQPGQPGQPMMYYAGPNMNPMPVYPTWVINEHGMMVQAMSVVPPMMPPAIPPQMPGSQNSANSVEQAKNSYVCGTPQNHSASSNTAGPASNPTPQRTPANDESEQDQFEPLPHNSTQPPIPFEDYVAMLPPDALEPAGLSFGSITMTDVDQRKLEATGCSFGSAMSFGLKPGQTGPSHPPSYPQSVNHQHNNTGSNNVSSTPSGNNQQDVVPAAIDGLEPTGISFGDVSMMSVSSKAKLENTGTSFGSMMSYNTTHTMRADAVDGGLEAIGTSFGSLSIDNNPNNNTNKNSVGPPPMPAGAEIPPMLHGQKSVENTLLYCSDTESEDSKPDPQLVAQKSAAWEKLQASVAAQTTKSQDGSADLMPPPPGGQNMMLQQQQQQRDMISNMPGNVVSFPTTSFERDCSQLSAWDDDFGDGGGGSKQQDDKDNKQDEVDPAMPPPPPMVKQTSDVEKLERFYLQRGDSLASDDFQDGDIQW